MIPQIGLYMARFLSQSKKPTFQTRRGRRYSMQMSAAIHRTTAQLEDCLSNIVSAPADRGIVEMIVRRPGEERREVVEKARLDPDLGLVGDDWINRVDENGEPHHAAQLTLMNSRAVDAFARSRERWPLAGDQLYVDLDLSVANMPAGTMLRVGEAAVRISETPHTGCAKFASRFGSDALRFANVGEGRELRLRGVNASIVSGGTVRTGDTVTKA